MEKKAVWKKLTKNIFGIQIWVEVYKTSAEAYYNYVEVCKAMGYVIDINEDDNSFEAYNEDGFHVDLDYYEGELNIDLYAPMEME